MDSTTGSRGQTPNERWKVGPWAESADEQQAREDRMALAHRLIGYKPQQTHYPA